MGSRAKKRSSGLNLKLEHFFPNSSEPKKKGLHLKLERILCSISRDDQKKKKERLHLEMELFLGSNSRKSKIEQDILCTVCQWGGAIVFSSAEISLKGTENMVFSIRGGVEDTRLEAKVKDTKKIRGQGQEQPFRGQNCSRPRTGMFKAKDEGHNRKCSSKKGLQKSF